MKKITQETINRIQEEVSIIDVVENYTKVVKRGYGSSYFGFCPFHNDVTNPSMSIDADKKLFHCFTCEESGNMIQFVQKKENLRFPEAVVLLGEKYGIPIEYDNPDDDGNEEAKVSYYKILKEAEAFFVSSLEKAEDAKKYFFEERRFSEETVKDWGLGWAPGYKNLYNHLKKKGYTDEVIAEIGLINFNEKRGEYQDTFFSRVIFPIRDVLGRTVGFGGRVLDDGKPKYLNSKENPVFHKRRTLYGLNVARKEIQKANEVIVAEGYVDTIMLSQHGIKYVVSALGTAFTSDHILILSRMTKNIYLCLDADAAGRSAAERGIDLLENTDAKVYVIEIPEEMGKDPDEFLKKYSSEEFLKIKEQASPIQKFIVKNIIAEFDLDSPHGRERAYNAAVDFVKEYRDTFSMFQGIETCDYIVSQLDMPVNGHELFKSISKETPKKNSNSSPAISPVKLIDASLELNVLRLMVDWPEYLPYFEANLKEEFFTTPQNRKLYKKTMETLKEDKDVRFINFEDEETSKLWTKFLMTHPTTDLSEKQAETTIRRSINSLHRSFIQSQLESLEKDPQKNMDEIFTLKLKLAKIPTN